jgi:protein TonB
MFEQKLSLWCQNLVVPLILLGILMTSIPAYSQIEKEKNKDDKQETIFKVVEQMPRFPGCENMESLDEKKDCSQEKMLKHIYMNLRYPASAREKGVQGLVVVQFIVNEEGFVEQVKAVRDIGEGCGEAAIEVVNSMNDLPDRWIPGKQRGKAVKVLYTLPVKFKLDTKEKE